jgi:hypothetical protein
MWTSGTAGVDVIKSRKTHSTPAHGTQVGLQKVFSKGRCGFRMPRAT